MSAAFPDLLLLFCPGIYNMEKYLRIGVITRPHGVHGEVKVYPTTDYAERFEEISEAVIRGPKGEIRASVDDVRYFKNLAIVKFSCFSTPEEARTCAGCDIMISREQAQPLEEGEYYIADLIGCRVIADEESGNYSGRTLGVLEDVLQTGANDVYAVRTPSGSELLFPVIPDCIRRVDIENSIVTVHVMKGLMD